MIYREGIAEKTLQNALMFSVVRIQNFFNVKPVVYNNH